MFRMSGWIRTNGAHAPETARRKLISLGIEVTRYDEVTKKFSVTMTEEVWERVQVCKDRGLVADRELRYSGRRPAA